MRAVAFVPGHITGFFEICDEKAIDATQIGSRGAGVVITKGVLTEVNAEKSSSTSINITIDEKQVPAPVTETVVKTMLEMAGQQYSISVAHLLEVPMKFGFGASGAGALGTAIALSKAIDLKLTLNDLGRIAHAAEVKNKTGLGDVIAQVFGGLEIRREPGPPGAGVVDRILVDDLTIVCAKIGSELETKAILTNPSMKMKINSAGRPLVRSIIKEPTVEKFFQLSKEFSIKSGLATPVIIRAVQEAEQAGAIGASMIMLGNAIFAGVKEDKVESVVKTLGKYGEPIVAKIDYFGARILK